jgi:heterodisulfide reductase subunit A
VIPLASLTELSGESGDFIARITQHPRYVDPEKCIACGLCAEKCPKKVPNEYDGGLSRRKAAYLKYPQAVPLKYAIDPENCLFLTRGRCRACEKVCPTSAIRLDDQEKNLTLHVGAVILAEGAEPYDPSLYDTYGYTAHPNVVTSLEFERILSASGPFGGHLLRPSDKTPPRKIAWLQCIGSRDEHIGAKGYCSAVCCTYAVKEAILAKEHLRGQLDTAIFYIDIRTCGKDFERYYNRAKDELGVRFVKSRITKVSHIDETGMNRLRYVDEEGRTIEEDFDLVVLSVGLEVSEAAANLAGQLGVALNPYRFADTGSFNPVQTNIPGIYVCGTFESPKDIPDSVVESSGAAGAVARNLASARWTRTKEVLPPEEVDIRGEPPRIGVFVCRCGTNIASVVDVPAVTAYARALPGVAYAEENMFCCSQDSLDKMARVITENRLNRVVVAACTPRTHEGLFQQTLIDSGLNKYLFEMANIRNQCSWVHKKDPDAATRKAIDLVHMAVSKARGLEPLQEPAFAVDPSVLVVGGGIAGMVAAENLSGQGYGVYLIERSGVLGGNARRLFETWRDEDIRGFLKKLIENVDSNPRITTYLNTEIESVEGFIGNFKTTVSCNGNRSVLEHGVTIIATGASEFKPDGYLYGQDGRVMTALELQERFIQKDASLRTCGTAVFVQCVGSRIPERPYCSKVCCTRSVHSAIKLKSINPEMNVFVLYRDMRTYGLREDLYRKARTEGVVFIRYDAEEELAVSKDGEELRVLFTDRVLKRKMEIRPDLLVLAAAIIPERKNALARLYKVAQNTDGFFAEAHAKLRPVEFATDGVFMCGLAQGPKPIEESVVQAQAAAAKAAAVLAAKTRTVSGTVAIVDPNYCSQCGVCIAICPFGAPKFNEKTRIAEIEPSLCKGCGLCVSSCRSGAIRQKGFETEQIMAMIESSCA